MLNNFDPWVGNLETVNGGTYFNGEYATGVYGGLVPVSNDLSHWDNSRRRWDSDINPSMFPTFSARETRTLTELDYAALADIGWQVTGYNYTENTPIPEPETWAMLLAGLGIMSVAAKRRHRLVAA